MRRSPLAIAAIACAIGAVAAEAQAPIKLGYINSQQILASSPDAAAAQRQFDQEMQGYQTEIQQLEEELTGLQESLQRQQLTLSPMPGRLVSSNSRRASPSISNGPPSLPSWRSSAGTS